MLTATIDTDYTSVTWVALELWGKGLNCLWFHWSNWRSGNTKIFVLLMLWCLLREMCTFVTIL